MTAASATFGIAAPARASRTAAAASGSERLAVLFLFEGDRDGRIGRQADLVTLDLGDETDGDEVVMVGMEAFLDALDVGTAVLLGQLDTVALDLVDGADMDAVRADDFCM